MREQDAVSHRQQHLLHPIILGGVGVERHDGSGLSGHFAPSARVDPSWLHELALGTAWAGGQRGFARTLRFALERIGPRGMLGFFLRFGPHGAGLSGSEGLTLERLEKFEHGVELGALEPRLSSVLATKSGRVELAPQPLLGDLPRAARRLEELERSPGLLLIGRRTLRSNNSWMHNSRRLVKGPPRCTLLMHPDDAAEYGVRSGQEVRVRSRVGSIVVPVEVSDELMPGVLSLPHGWGHSRGGSAIEAQLSVLVVDRRFQI